MEISKDRARDYISDLPQNIIDKILMLLPIEDAVRTTVLSKKWMYKWITIPELVFIDKFKWTQKLVSFIDRVLILHKGPLTNFTYYFLWSHNSLNLNQWIIHLANKEIKELIINSFCINESITMPSYLYSCLNLTHLELFNCTLREPPPNFVGFKSLKSLILHHPDIKSPSFDRLLSSCPVLERLKIVSLMPLYLYSCLNLTHLELSRCALKEPPSNFVGFRSLKSLNLFEVDNKSGCFDSFLSICPVLERLEIVSCRHQNIRICAPNLKWLCINATVSITINKTRGTEDCLMLERFYNLIKVLSSLDGLEKLVVRDHFVKYLSVGYAAGKFRNATYNHLKYLELDDATFGHKELSATLFLVISSRNIQELQISAMFN
ncbi:F-box domain [Macleaya cordata]|uniref:F-box domain n=1 Tax=Macleaya cordata TaxID=56857 RepID=A0A200QQL9_MACCD|nr:F-box domain [Macleaya cordata]